MKNVLKALTVLCLIASCETKTSKPQIDHTKDFAQIIESIDAWNKAWESKDIQLAIKYYADEIDWTNAFGDRVQSKDELKALLESIFDLDFVMSGENDYGQIEIVHLNDSIATVQSKNIRKNQKWPDGLPMDDRYINHLRVYKNIKGEWLIINHMISQAWPKNRPMDRLTTEN
jgi:ketosteroid isomerase-like protein